MKILGNEIKPGMIIEHKNDLWSVLKTQHVKPGKGGAFNQVELKSVKKGTRLYIIGGVILFLASLYGPFNPAITGMYPDGIVPENFALFTIPMHIIVALGALIMVPRFVLTD